MTTSLAAGASRLRRIGIASRSLLGVIVLVVVVASGLAAVSGILVPLIVAAIIGSLLEPVVMWLERRGMGATPAAALALIAALAGTALTAWIIARGLLGQVGQIHDQMITGWENLLAWGRSLEFDAALLEQLRVNVERYLPDVARGALGWVTGTFSGVIAFGLGTFFAFFLLFFMLRDLRAFPSWAAQIGRVDAGLMTELADTVKLCLRGYFKGVAITALITAPIFMVPLLLLRVPLAVPIFILYFGLSFIPFLGAWITGAVAVLVAFGSGGPTAALIIAITFVVSNGTIQSAVSSWALGSALRIHPVAVLVATMVGGTVAGLLGMVLAAPLVAAGIKSVAAIRRHRQEDAASGQPGEVSSPFVTDDGTPVA